jgi:hypothetical protein
MEAPVARYFFEMLGVGDFNAKAVIAELKRTKGMTCHVSRSSRGAYILVVETEFSETEAMQKTEQVLTRFEVRLVRSFRLGSADET